VDNQLTTILTEGLFILLHFFVLIANMKLFKKQSFHPAVLFSFVWLVMIVVHILLRLTILPQLYPLTSQVHWVFFIGCLCFSLGGVLQTLNPSATKVSKSNYSGTISQDKKVNILFCVISTIAVAIGLPFYIKAIFNIFIQSQAEDFFKGVRIALCYDDADIGPSKYFVVLSFIVFAFNLICFYTTKNKTKYNWILLFASLSVSIVYAVFSTGRTFFMMIFAIYIGISYIYSKQFSIKKIAGLLLIIILGFGIMGVFLYQKGGDPNGTLEDNLISVSKDVGIYTSTPQSALSVDIQKPKITDYSGSNSLRFFFKMLAQFNLSTTSYSNSLIEEYTFVPYATNVYTVYHPYIKDFGIFYAFAILMLFGIIHTMSYTYTVVNKSLSYSIYYAFLLYPVIMSFFEDQYFSLFSTWLQVVIFTEVLVIINNFFVKRVESHTLTLARQQ
jgi:oligosaccharide repeat unit polymerase